MVTTVFMNIAYFIIASLLFVLPKGGAIPASWGEGIGIVMGYVNAFSYFFPVSQLLTAVGIILAFDLFLFFWKFIPWVLQKLPFLHMK